MPEQADYSSAGETSTRLPHGMRMHSLYPANLTGHGAFVHRLHLLPGCSSDHAGGLRSVLSGVEEDSPH